MMRDVAIGQRRRPRQRQVSSPPPPQHLPPLSPPSDAGGAWPVDHAAALEYARRTLRSLDLTKPTLVLWVSGTANPAKGEFPQINANFANEVYRLWQDGGVSLGLLRYASNWDIRGSIATGVQALREVLRGVAALPNGPKILLAGESQGAWVIGEALRDPVARGAVTRTAIWGHPSVAATHYSDGHDATVREVNHRWDHVAMPITGSKALAMEGLIALETQLSLAKAPLLARALLNSPLQGVLAIVGLIRSKLPAPLKVMVPEPHNYRDDFRRGVEFLRGALG